MTTISRFFFRWSKAEEPVKTCWNCDKVVFGKGGEDQTRCSEGSWNWDSRDALYLIIKINGEGCELWSLLESLRNKRGEKTEW